VECMVITATAWAPEVLRPLGIRLAVAPQRGQITDLRLEGIDTEAWPSIRCSSSRLARFRLPLGLPAGLPDWPGVQRVE